MHISEGVLNAPILATGALISLGALTLAYKTMRNEDISKIAVLSALFFLASFIHVPVGPSSVHLILAGLVGALLGLQAFIAIFIALLLQSLLFGYGGITTLGINLCILASPALLASWLFTHAPLKKPYRQISWFLIGFLPLMLSAILLSFVLAFNGEAFMVAAKVALGAHIPVMIIEGLIALFALQFIDKVAPSILEKA